MLLPRLVSEMSIKRLLLMIVSENERYEFAVGYAVYDEPPKEITSEALEKSSLVRLNWHD